MKRPYLLHKRGKYWYYRLADQRTFHSTGQTSKGKAEDYILSKVLQPQPSAVRLQTFGELFKDAFLWETCVHVRRLRDEGKAITEYHAQVMRRLLEMYVFDDEICKRPVSTLIRADMLNLRDRIRKRTTPNQTNRTMKAVRTIFNEFKNRQELERNPTDGVGKLKEPDPAIGVFTSSELQGLFEECPGVWGNAQVYAAFLLAAMTGMRRGEILGLTWRQVGFDDQAIAVDQAIKGGGKLGDPKWGNKRETFLPDKVSQALLEVRNNSLHVLPNSYVFCGIDGARRGGTWWQQRFTKAMVAAGFMRLEEGVDGKKVRINPRSLTPHCLRHSVHTILLAGGEDAALLRATFGWTNEQTQRRYTHLSSEVLGNQRKKVDEVFKNA